MLTKSIAAFDIETIPDLPVIRYRFIKHGIAAPDFYRTDGDRKWNNYQNPFHDHILQGEEETVFEYCKLDCLDTLLVFLAWTVYTGQLEHAGLRHHVDVIRRGLAEEAYAAWGEISGQLEDWPHWPSMGA